MEVSRVFKSWGGRTSLEKRKPSFFQEHYIVWATKIIVNQNNQAGWQYSRWGFYGTNYSITELSSQTSNVAEVLTHRWFCHITRFKHRLALAPPPSLVCAFLCRHPKYFYQKSQLPFWNPCTCNKSELWILGPPFSFPYSSLYWPWLLEVDISWSSIRLFRASSFEAAHEM